MGFLSRFSSFFGHHDEDALSVPPMDGILKPNNRLDTAEHVLYIPQLDNLAVLAGRAYCSSGNALLRIDLNLKCSETIRTFDGPITAITASSSGKLMVAVEGIGMALLADEESGYRLLDMPSEHAACITAALFEDEDNIVFAVGSCKHPMSDWKRDLMSHGATGAIIRYQISTGASQTISAGLAFPYGLASSPTGDLLVAESWRHRIVKARSRKDELAELPAYPARLSPASGGGHWLALFAPRRQLTELVLQEDDYRLEMMATIPPEAWIGPDFSDGGGEEQPLQSGSVRQMGIMKPWAPSRSYGLVVRLDDTMTPVASYHSRADGRIHGVASVAEWDGTLYVASRGAGELVRMDLNPGATV